MPTWVYFFLIYRDIRIEQRAPAENMSISVGWNAIRYPNAAPMVRMMNVFMLGYDLLIVDIWV